MSYSNVRVVPETSDLDRNHQTNYVSASNRASVEQKLATMELGRFLADDSFIYLLHPTDLIRKPERKHAAASRVDPSKGI
jgi:hypothetical protein